MAPGNVCLAGRGATSQTGVWVRDGCSGEFAFGGSAQQVTRGRPRHPQAPREPTPRIETWGKFDPGDGFLVGRTKLGELAISAYGVVRFMDQTPASHVSLDLLSWIVFIMAVSGA